MHPLVPYLLGEKHPGGNRLTGIQKCVRTDDIDEVGDDTHLTFFEMLGNWSLGDYFKEKSISMSYEFLTKHLHVPAEKLAVTVFAGDALVPADMEAEQYIATAGKRTGADRPANAESMWKSGIMCSCSLIKKLTEAFQNWSRKTLIQVWVWSES